MVDGPTGMAVAVCVVMTRESRRLAGILLVVLPTVMYGGATLLHLLTNDPQYVHNEVRQDLWRAGHAHAGVLLLLSLVMLRYIDDAVLPRSLLWLARHGAPIAAILMPAGFFLAMPTPSSHAPGPAIHLVHAGAAVLAASVLALGIGLLRRHREPA
jgi:hypothetical protein